MQWGHILGRGLRDSQGHLQDICHRKGQVRILCHREGGSKGLRLTGVPGGVPNEGIEGAGWRLIVGGGDGEGEGGNPNGGSLGGGEGGGVNPGEGGGLPTFIAQSNGGIGLRRWEVGERIKGGRDVSGDNAGAASSGGRGVSVRTSAFSKWRGWMHKRAVPAQNPLRCRISVEEGPEAPRWTTTARQHVSSRPRHPFPMSSVQHLIPRGGQQSHLPFTLRPH